MVDGIKSSTEVNEDENVKGTCVSGQEEVVNYVKKVSLCAVKHRERKPD